MTIAVADLKFYSAERMTDEDDGGGQMSAVEITDGSSHSIFDDLSDVDRAAGDCSIRKIYALVASDSADKYLDAGVVVFTPPADPAVSVLAFSTGSFYDERTAHKAKLELAISRGATYQGWLYGDHTAGQRAVVLWQRPSSELPATGLRIDLSARANGAETHSQTIWITRIVEQEVEKSDEKGPYKIRVVTLELADALRDDYVGTEPSRYDPSAPATKIFNTRYNQDAVALYSIAPLVEAGSVGDRSVVVDDLYKPLIPTAFSETPLADVTPGGDTAALVKAGTGAVTFSTSLACVKPGVNLFLGSPAQPGSVSVSVSGSTITDDNGALKLSGTVVGSIAYSSGVCTWNDACPNYGTASKSVTFKPAALPLRIADTASQVVTVENRGFVWVMTLSPIPAPGGLRVAYRVNNAWYVIQDQGGGKLSGVDSSYGSGTLDSTTGTVTITTGALPDVDSEILYAWTTPVTYTARGGDPVDPPKVSGKTANGYVKKGSVTVTWTVGATTYTLTDNNGALAGTGGSGKINYVTGDWYVTPSTLPPTGADFHIAYQWGQATPVEDTFDAPARGGDGKLHLTLSEAPEPGTIVLMVPVVVDDYQTVYTTGKEYIPPSQPGSGDGGGDTEFTNPYITPHLCNGIWQVDACHTDVQWAPG